MSGSALGAAAVCDYKCDLKKCTRRFNKLVALPYPIYLVRPLMRAGKVGISGGIMLSPLNGIIPEYALPDCMEELWQTAVYVCSKAGGVHIADPFYKIAKVQQLVNENTFIDHTLPLLAGDIGISPVWLSKQFKKHSGMNLQEYIMKLRFCMALWRVVTSNTALKAIAIEVGYKDPLYFSKAFKTHFGMAPNAIRKENSESLHAYRIN